MCATLCGSMVLPWDVTPQRHSSGTSSRPSHSPGNFFNDQVILLGSAHRLGEHFLLKRLSIVATELEIALQKNIGQKLAHPSLYHSFRRYPRGGLELTQVEELAKVINPVVLTQSPDSWSWTLNNSGGYTVASSRNMIDSRLLPKGDLKTRWIRYVPNKVNTFAWK
ncbi:hypothetical protein Tco_1336313, partial [Tanacetum coccineum]